MNPVVVIASHGRMSITCENIDSLLEQSVTPKIILVVSNESERRIYSDAYFTKDVKVIISPNYPLGHKWQAGVNAAYSMDAGPLIINGSDDILGIDFVKNACLMSEEFDFIGLFQWFVWSHGHLYKFDYNAKIPLGAGRIYSNALLKKINWSLFDVRASRRLDDHGYLSAIRSIGSSRQWLFVEDVEAYNLNVVSIKGTWGMMNDFTHMLKSPNCHLLTKEKGSERLEKLIGFKPSIS